MGSSKTVKKSTDLVVGEKYKINEMTLVKTKYGEQYLVDLGDTVYYLPKRFSVGLAKLKNFDASEIPDNLHMIVVDRENNEGKSPILKFVIEENEKKK